MELTCTMCGRIADPRLDGHTALAWSLEATDPPRHVCPECTREHVRAIEAKLDQQWW